MIPRLRSSLSMKRFSTSAASKAALSLNEFQQGFLGFSKRGQKAIQNFKDFQTLYLKNNSNESLSAVEQKRYSNYSALWKGAINAVLTKQKGLGDTYNLENESPLRLMQILRFETDSLKLNENKTTGKVRRKTIKLDTLKDGVDYDSFINRVSILDTLVNNNFNTGLLAAERRACNYINNDFTYGDAEGEQKIHAIAREVVFGADSNAADAKQADPVTREFLSAYIDMLRCADACSPQAKADKNESAIFLRVEHRIGILSSRADYQKKTKLMQSYFPIIQAKQQLDILVEKKPHATEEINQARTKLLHEIQLVRASYPLREPEIQAKSIRRLSERGSVHKMHDDAKTPYKPPRESISEPNAQDQKVLCSLELDASTMGLKYLDSLGNKRRKSIATINLTKRFTEAKTPEQCNEILQELKQTNEYDSSNYREYVTSLARWQDRIESMLTEYQQLEAKESPLVVREQQFAESLGSDNKENFAKVKLDLSNLTPEANGLMDARKKLLIKIQSIKNLPEALTKAKNELADVEAQLVDIGNQLYEQVESKLNAFKGEIESREGNLFFDTELNNIQEQITAVFNEDFDLDVDEYLESSSAASYIKKINTCVTSIENWRCHCIKQLGGYTAKINYLEGELGVANESIARTKSIMQLSPLLNKGLGTSIRKSPIEACSELTELKTIAEVSDVLDETNAQDDSKQSTQIDEVRQSHSQSYKADDSKHVEAGVPSKTVEQGVDNKANVVAPSKTAEQGADNKANVETPSKTAEQSVDNKADVETPSKKAKPTLGKK